MLVFIEFTNRKSGVELRRFHEVVGRERSEWADRFADDRLILNVARTWWLGPKPEYMTVWYCPSSGLERIDEWEDIARSRVMASLEQPFLSVTEIEMTGCYRPLLEPVAGTGPVYYGEYFDFSQRVSRDEVNKFFAQRRDTHTNLTLNLVVDRIGKLGPSPRGLAVWQLPSYAALESIAGELEDPDAPIELVTGALYADIGKEMPAPLL